MLKKTIYLLIILIILSVLCGCTYFSERKIDHGSFDTTAVLHIYLNEFPEGEYIPAEITSKWTGNEISASVEIKQRGNSTKESEKKSFNIKFEEEISFMGMDPGEKWCIIGTPFDKSLLRSVIGFDYADAIGLPYVPDTRLCDLWINNQYMGVYTVTEPVEAGTGRVEIDPDNGDFLLERNVGRTEDDKSYIISSLGFRFEFNEPDEPSAEDKKRCRGLLENAEAAIITCDHTVYEKYIDVDSFVNYYIFHEMIKDVDFGEYSTRYYFKEGKLYAGPPWDLDLTQGNVSDVKGEYKYSRYHNIGGTGDYSERSTSGLWANNSDYYYWLCNDPWFLNKVQQRWEKLQPVTESMYKKGGMIDRYYAVHGKSLEKNFSEEGAGWEAGIPEHVTEYQSPADTYKGNTELLRMWLKGRKAYLDTQFGNKNFIPQVLYTIKTKKSIEKIKYFTKSSLI